jgi:hypothetical protein
VETARDVLQRPHDLIKYDILDAELLSDLLILTAGLRSIGDDIPRDGVVARDHIFKRGFKARTI